MALLLVWALLRGNSLVIVTPCPVGCPIYVCTHISVLFLFFSFLFSFFSSGSLAGSLFYSELIPLLRYI
jgi:hypothetical protein